MISPNQKKIQPAFSNFLLADYADNFIDVIISIDIHGIIRHWNKAAEGLYGLTALETIGRPITDFTCFIEIGTIENLFSEYKQVPVKDYETIHHHKNGKPINVLVSTLPLKNKTAKIIGICIFVHDITYIKSREQQLAIQYEVAVILSEALDLKAAAKDILKSIGELLQLQMGEIWFVNQVTNELNSVAFWFEKDFYRSLEKLSTDLHFKMGKGLPGYIWKKKQPCWIGDLTKDKMTIRKVALLEKGMQSCLGFPIIFQKQVLGVVLFFSNEASKINVNFTKLFTAIGNQLGSFIKQKEIEMDLLYIAEHDKLTGLRNRYALDNALKNAIDKAALNHNLLALLYLDLDNFKKINDTLGHVNGDYLLQEVARRIIQCCRYDDIIARSGGDEFIILLPKLSRREDIELIAKKILRTIAVPIILNKNEFYITVSIGISIYPDAGKNALTLLKNADMAMYQAKLHGGNNYQFFLPNLAKKSQGKVILENKLYEALKNNKFVLHYQPKVAVYDNKIIGCEALIRLQDKNRLMFPGEFIALAEETNLIIPITEWVLRTASFQMQQWLDKGLCQSMTLAVNISSHQFFSNFMLAIESILEETGLEPNYLELEFTENTLLDISKFNLSSLIALKKLGIQLSIDDFGTGYSSFTYLKNFKVDFIKIDQSFIADLALNLETKAIVFAMITMAHALNIKVIAEGVEHLKQLELLKTIGCDIYQGFLFSAPLTAEEVTNLFLN